MKATITLLTCFVLIQSCTKEVATEAEVVSSKLTDVVASQHVSRVICFEGTANFDNTTIIGNVGDNFTFDKQFVTVSGKAWNLHYLRRYEVRTVNNLNYLGLFF